LSDAGAVRELNLLAENVRNVICLRNVSVLKVFGTREMCGEEAGLFAKSFEKCPVSRIWDAVAEGSKPGLG
jgi:hypothetical protein